MNWIDNLRKYFSNSVSGTMPAERIAADKKKMQEDLAELLQPQEPTGYQAPMGPSPFETVGKPARNPYGEDIYNIFGPELAQQAERVLRWGNPIDGVQGETFGGENQFYDPKATNENVGGSMDYGLFQINSQTLEDMLARYPDEMAALGISTVEDLFDPVKNINMAKLVYQDRSNWDPQGGWGGWYGRDPTL